MLTSNGSLRSLRRHLSAIQTLISIPNLPSALPNPNTTATPTPTNPNARRRARIASLLSSHRCGKWAPRAGFSTEASGVREEDEAGSYLFAEIQCERDVADSLSEALLCFGASSTSMDDTSGCADVDNKICITSIFPDCQDMHKGIALAADSIGLRKVPVYELKTGDPNNWLSHVQESFQPIEVYDRLWIVPQWRTPPDVRATNIILNPGMAFGTGEHPTTKLCLLLLNKLIRGGETLLDYGTGSGILAIAALKMGASLSVGMDIDPQAISSAQQNMALNQIHSDKMQLYLASGKANHLESGRTSDDLEESAFYHSVLGSRRGKFDLVLANILLNPLVELAEEIVSYGKPGAVIGVSGILVDQLPQIETCYARYLDNISTTKLEGWACLSGNKRIT